MSMKVLAAALLASALVSAPALAQSSPPAAQPNQPAAQPAQPSASSGTQAASTTQKAGTWRASKLIGLNVYNNNNEKIGDIKELITDQSGKIDLVVIGVGGFLGMGEHNVGLPLSQVKFVDQPPRQATTGAADRPATTTTASSSGPRDYPDHAVLNTTKDQLKAMPAFRYASDTRSTAPASSTPPARTPPAGQPAPQR